jgi:hypothetical protein
LRQDRDSGKQKLKGAVRTETHWRYYCQQDLSPDKLGHDPSHMLPIPMELRKTTCALFYLKKFIYLFAIY